MLTETAEWSLYRPTYLLRSVKKPKKKSEKSQLWPFSLANPFREMICMRKINAGRFIIFIQIILDTRIVSAFL